MQRNVCIGDEYARWRVIGYSEKRGPHHYWLCQCECGNRRSIQQGSLVSGASRSCGCLRVEVNRELHTTHGASTGHAGYQTWTAMRRRCRDPKFEGYEYYGARGIDVCDRWFDSFEAFWSDMGRSWFDGGSIDRLDVNGNYEPANCRWATDREQANNKRNNALIDTPWGTMSKADAARRAGISRTALKHRIERNWAPSRWFGPTKATAA